MRGQSAERARAALHERLSARRGEIEQALLARVYGLSDPLEALDPEYADGLRAAVGAALDYSLAVVELGESRSPPIPAPLLTQVRLAARNRIGLDTVLRRYLAGYTLLNDFLLEEAGRGRLIAARELRRLIRSQAALFDRLLAAVSEEYGREERSRRDLSSAHRLVERIEALLAGELLDTAELGYDLNAFHLGIIATGPGAEEAIRQLTQPLDCQLLAVGCGNATVWAWLGGRQKPDPVELERTASSALSRTTTLSFGEIGHHLAGWRLTHRQARAAQPIARRNPGTVVRYADVALQASMLQDDLLAVSLRELYLEPLAEERDGGGLLRETLRAYFNAGRNATSAAVTLGVTRQAVTSRLRVIERKLGRSLDSCGADLEAVLKLEELGSVANSEFVTRQVSNSAFCT